MSKLVLRKDTPPCTCGSLAAINEKRHAPDCKRRLWVERQDQMRAVGSRAGSWVAMQGIEPGEKP